VARDFRRGFPRVAEASGVRVESREQFEAWLDEKKPPKDICVALAARAALRALALIATARFPDAQERARRCADLAAAIFRATALARVAATYPIPANDRRARERREKDLRAAVTAAYRVADDSAAAALNGFAAARAARAAGAAAAAAFAPDPVEAVVYAADAGAVSVAAAYAAAAFWEALADDLAFVEAGASARDLANRPIWPDEAPPTIADLWRDLEARLPQGDGWSVWTRWYEARLSGEAWSEARERLYAAAPEENWKQGPAAVNAWIAAQLAKLDAKP